MNQISAKIDAEIKSAMKAKNAPALEVLRMLKTAISMKEIEKGKEVTEDEALAILKSYVKQQEDAKASFAQGGRADLVAKSEAEIAFVKQYLPAAMPEAELRKIVQAKIAELQATPAMMGKVIGAVIKETQGRADGAMVQQVIKEMLK